MFQVILQTTNEAVARRLFALAKAEVELALLMQATNPKLPGMMVVVASHERVPAARRARRAAV